jgi:hypothetical protein
MRNESAERPDGLAVASLVTSLVAVVTLCAPIGVAGAALGHAARSRARSSGTEVDGMALAGIVVGWAGAALTVAAMVLTYYWLRHPV